MIVAQSGQRIEKPEPREILKARQDREDVKQLKGFRDAVWLRESRLYGFDPKTARCLACHIIVFRDQEPRGEVHHKIPRSRCTRDQRYDPTNGEILCGYMANDCHGKAQRHEISV